MQTNVETKREYDSLYLAFNYFNEKLFNSQLPMVLITIVRKKYAHGYFWGDSLKVNDKSDVTIKVCEIALNPETFDRPEIEVFSTLVHEMVHLWQHIHGTNKPKRAYHNKEWANRMIDVGLMPTTDGTTEGKQTGRNCTHIIIEEGRFKKYFELMPSQIRLSIAGIKFFTTKKKSKENLKTSYQCEYCEYTVYGKKGLHIICGDCEEKLIEQ